MRPLAIVDYGMGNLRSVAKAFVRLGHAAEVTHDPERIATAPGVVLPGVGAFGACMTNLTVLGLVEPVRHAIRSGRPFLGICLGMQLLFEESEEFGPVAGLGVLPGRVVRFPADPERKVPHMGWNALRIVRAAPALAGIDDGAYVYFVHSYYPVPADPAVSRAPRPTGASSPRAWCATTSSPVSSTPRRASRWASGCSTISCATSHDRLSRDRSPRRPLRAPRRGGLR